MSNRKTVKLIVSNSEGHIYCTLRARTDAHDPARAYISQAQYVSANHSMYASDDIRYVSPSSRYIGLELTLADADGNRYNVFVDR